MSSDIVINIEYPGVQYEPLSPESSNAVYHEDREVTLDVTGSPGSQMWRTYNAQFDKANALWKCIDTTKPAYATVQNPDGSIHFYFHAHTTSEWALSAWEGSDNNTVFNAADYKLGAPGNMPTDNLNALIAALNAIGKAGGGILFIPQGLYQISGTVTLSTSSPYNFPDVGIVIMGAGGSTELVQTTSGDTFDLSGFNSGRGIRFQGLRITYQTSPSFLTGKAIYASQCENVSCERVYFRNCPQAFYTDNHCLQCGLFDCTIDYSSGSNNAVMVYISGTQDYISQCVIQQQPQNPTMGGPTGCVAVEIGSAGSPYVTDVQINDFTIGIKIDGDNGGTKPIHGFFSNLICQCWTSAVVIQPLVSGGIVRQLLFENFVFARTNDSTDTSSTGVTISAYSGDSNSHVSDIIFANGLCYQWNGPGIQITTGQNIQINGGRYGSCATSMSTSGGIAVIGTAANITVNGADCTPTVPGYSAQPYAVSVTAAVAGLYVRASNLSGYSSGPLHVSATGLTLEVTDCPGYNDQGTIVSSVAPPTATTFNAAYSGFANPYYGPATFYTLNSSGATIAHIKLNGSDTNLKSGSFSVGPGTWTAEIDYSGIAGAEPLFLMVGQ